jgi:hypothetical protein
VKVTVAQSSFVSKRSTVPVKASPGNRSSMSFPGYLVALSPAA